MNSTEITLEQRLERIEAAFARLEKIIANSPLLQANAKPTLWMTEAEASKMLDLGTTQLRRLRQNDVIRYSTASGRKIKYHRKDVELYLEGKKRGLTKATQKEAN